MGRFLLKRLANYLVLPIVATTIGCAVASLALNPRSRYEGRNPPVPESSIAAQLSAVGINDKDPLLERYLNWIGGVLHGDFGLTVTGTSINEQLGGGALVSLRPLIVGVIIGAVVGGLAGVVSALKY